MSQSGNSVESRERWRPGDANAPSRSGFASFPDGDIDRGRCMGRSGMVTARVADTDATVDQLRAATTDNPTTCSSSSLSTSPASCPTSHTEVTAGAATDYDHWTFGLVGLADMHHEWLETRLEGHDVGCCSATTTGCGRVDRPNRDWLPQAVDVRGTTSDSPRRTNTTCTSRTERGRSESSVSSAVGHKASTSARPNPEARRGVAALGMMLGTAIPVDLLLPGAHTGPGRLRLTLRAGGFGLGSRRSRVGACLIADLALSPASSGCPVAKSITLHARLISRLGPSAQRMAGTGNPHRVRWRCTVVSRAAVAGSGMIRATRGPSSSAVGSDNSMTYISAQYPPVSAAGGLVHAIAG